MKDVVKLIIDRVFSGSTLFIIAMVVFLFIMYRAVIDGNVNAAQRKANIAACYNHGMVLVETDAGSRCALPANLIAFK